MRMLGSRLHGHIEGEVTMKVNHVWSAGAAGVCAAAFVSVAIAQASGASGGETVTATGVVYVDANRNGVRDEGERGIADVGVSNGADIVRTDETGRYELAIDARDGQVFVIKPRGFMPPVDELNLPEFYYIHKPDGSPGHLEHEGVPPTGPLPASIDFPMHAQSEPDTFRIVMFGDTQPRDVKEVNYFAHDVAGELIGVDAAFGVTLGDVVFDDLSVFGAHNQVVSTIGLPWINVHGNHDENYDVTRDALADETWERIYGPATYSFDWGPVHFIALDDVMYDGHEKKGRYHAELTDGQLRYIANDLASVADDQLIVLMMHIPMNEIRNLDALFGLLEGRAHTFSLSAHTHTNEHRFFDAEDGWLNDEPHHHHVHGTVCGSWWAGVPDERGIPNPLMADGTPNGYSFITFTGNEYAIRYKASNRPAHQQMTIFCLSEIARAHVAQASVFANVWNGSERSEVSMRIVGRTDWMAMERMRDKPAPSFLQLKMMEEEYEELPGREMPKPGRCTHLWALNLPADLPVGVHVIEVRSVDMFGVEDVSRRIVRVEEG
jgi:hypothetical protein